MYVPDRALKTAGHYSSFRWDGRSAAVTFTMPEKRKRINEFPSSVWGGVRRAAPLDQRAEASAFSSGTYCNS
jgi:hypothetical protein